MEVWCSDASIFQDTGHCYIYNKSIKRRYMEMRIETMNTYISARKKKLKHKSNQTYPSFWAKGNTNPPRQRSTWRQISKLDANWPSSCKRSSHCCQWRSYTLAKIHSSNLLWKTIKYLNRINNAMRKTRCRSNNLQNELT